MARHAKEPASIPPAIVHRENAEHYQWGTDCEGWHLVKDEQLSVIEEEMPPGTAEVRPMRGRNNFSIS